MPCESPYKYMNCLQCEVKQDCGKAEKILRVYRNLKWDWKGKYLYVSNSTVSMQLVLEELFI